MTQLARPDVHDEVDRLIRGAWLYAFDQLSEAGWKFWPAPRFLSSIAFWSERHDLEITEYLYQTIADATSISGNASGIAGVASRTGFLLRQMQAAATARRDFIDACERKPEATSRSARSCVDLGLATARVLQFERGEYVGGELLEVLRRQSEGLARGNAAKTRKRQRWETAVDRWLQGLPLEGRSDAALANEFRRTHPNIAAPESNGLDKFIGRWRRENGAEIPITDVRPKTAQ